jgi:hypothetical protein
MMRGFAFGIDIVMALVLAALIGLGIVLLALEILKMLGVM